MTDQAITDALVRTLKASEYPKGRLWYPLMVEVRDELKVSTEEVNVGILEAIDRGLIDDNETGWLKLKPLIDNADVPEPVK